MLHALIALALLAPPPVTPVDLPDVDQLAAAMTTIKPKIKGARAIAGAAIEAGARYSVSPFFLLGVAYTESRWNVSVKAGDKGRSFGLYQMTLGVARAVDFAGVFEDKPGRKQITWALRDVWCANYIAAAYINRLRRKYGRAAMVVYNCGPVRCRQSSGKQRKETPATRGYWRNYRKLKRAYKRIGNAK